MNNRTEGFVEQPEGKIFYCAYEGDNEGIPLLVVHGGPGYSHDTLEIISPVASNRTVVFYDQLGCGRSDRPKDKKLWTLEIYVDELDNIINYFGFDEYHVLGHSFGGSIAVEYGLKKPSGLRSLTLSSPLISVKDWLSDTNFRKKELPQEVQNVIEKHESDGSINDSDYLNAIEIFNNNFLCRLDPKPEVFLKAFQNFNLELYKHMWGPSEFNCSGTLASFDRSNDLGKLKVPVLLLCGDRDEIRPETMRSYLKKLSNSGSRLYVLSNAAHSSYLEATEEYIAVLDEFLCGVGLL